MGRDKNPQQDSFKFNNIKIAQKMLSLNYHVKPYAVEKVWIYKDLWAENVVLHCTLEYFSQTHDLLTLGSKISQKPLHVGKKLHATPALTAYIRPLQIPQFEGS